METLAYARPRELVNGRGWRAWFWRHRLAACFLLALVSGPFSLNWMVHEACGLVGLTRALSWQLMVATAVGSHALVFGLWVGVAVSLLYDDRTLTDAEEAMMPLTLVLLTTWGVADMMAAAICAAFT